MLKRISPFGRKMKKPSATGRWHLGQQTSVRASAQTKYSRTTSPAKSPAIKPLPSPEQFFTAEIDGLTEYSDGWAWGHCPFHADANPSFTVNLETGVFKCMSTCCGVRGKGLVSFVSQLHGIDRKSARRILGGGA